MAAKLICLSSIPCILSDCRRQIKYPIVKISSPYYYRNIITNRLMRAFYKMLHSIQCAMPSSSFDSVISSAMALTSSIALPIAIPLPQHFSMPMSL